MHHPHCWKPVGLSAIAWLCFAGIPSTALGAPIQLDPAFKAGSGSNNTVQALAEEPGGTLWIGGSFSTLNGAAKYGVAKLDAVGNVDPAFAPPFTTSAVTCIVPLCEGEILIGRQSNEPLTTQAVSIAAGGDHSLILSAGSPIPRISTSLIATGKPGLTFSLTPIAENGPSTFTAQGLPPGLVINPQTGAINGIPTRGGDFLVTLAARNGFGISSRHIRLFIGPCILGWGNSVPGSIPQAPGDVAQVAAGTTHGLALHRNGTGWGSNSYGERTIPTGLTSVIAIAAGENFGLALKSDGTVQAWGRNPRNSSPFVNPLATGVVAIDSSGSGATALMTNGTA